MTEIDFLKYELKEERKAFEKLHKKYIYLLKQQEELEKENERLLYDVVDVLNELSDECEFLKIENEVLEDGATKYAELYHKSLKENEQLKQEIDTLQEQIAHFDIGDV